ncbi:MAG TPA: GHMP kinase [Chloroflexi bacterium]|nr:GHMP kinase [Chloroflexota bacterium]HCU98736.1 GHMP kinase [Chloroflexota bacterium]|tara:strand:- start:530 stop:1507 length:978 start_codon:yes stop_codon:yes gene_type:complete
MIVVRTPLRVSFLGGGTDFADFFDHHKGMVLSTAIDKYIYVIIKQRFDEEIYINYSRKEIVDNIEDIQHELVREAMRITGVDRGVEITTLADVPSTGTGLGSSSSVTVGLLQALYSYKGQLVTAETLAKNACDIEIEICKKPIGMQDQYISAYGGLREISFDKDNSIVVSDLLLDPEVKRRLNRNLMLFYTNVSRPSESILTEQKMNIDNSTDTLIELSKLAKEGRNLLKSGDLDSFGEMLHKGWELKQGLASGVSNSVINDLYNATREVGVIGGKIAGAGGGGFLLLYAPLGIQDDVRSVLSNLRELPFVFEPDGSKVVFNLGR